MWTYDWWRDIWIPALLGLATLSVSIVAVRTARRASKLAHEVELQRERAAEERQEEERRRLVLGMAIEEARALHRYVVEARKRRIGRRSYPIGETPPQTPVELARDNARVMLEQSIVPGADVLLMITELDLERMEESLPDGNDPDTGEPSEHFAALREGLIMDRERRTKQRIRDWASSPQESEPRILEELRSAWANPESYAQPGHFMDDRFLLEGPI